MLLEKMCRAFISFRRRCVFATYSDIGGRLENQDYIVSQKVNKGYLFVVADGLGGHKGGSIASQIAAETVCACMQANDNLELFLDVAIQSANQAIVKKQTNEIANMKTTVAAVYLTRKHAQIAHVGDSRIYAFKNGEIIFQSIDHSATQMAVLLGEITKDEMRFHPDRNRLTRALGVPEKVRVEEIALPRQDFDALLLCSDGFWEDVLERDMCEQLMRAKSPKMWLDGMKRLIASEEEHDNHSAIVAFC